MPVLPEVVGGNGGGGSVVDSTPGLGTTLVMGFLVSTDSLLTPRAEAGWVGDFCGKSGVVLALGGAPVMGGAEGLGAGGGGSTAEGGREMLGIGLVTAVDQAGGADETGTGSRLALGLMGRVLAAETFGRGVGTIFVESGLRGRGGRLIRSVSRSGAFGSEPGSAESAIISPFYSYFGKCSMAKFAIVTYLWFYMVCQVEIRAFSPI